MARRTTCNFPGRVPILPPESLRWSLQMPYSIGRDMELSGTLAKLVTNENKTPISSSPQPQVQKSNYWKDLGAIFRDRLSILNGQRFPTRILCMHVRKWKVQPSHMNAEARE